MNLSRHKRALKETIEDFKKILDISTLVICTFFALSLMMLPIILYDSLFGSFIVGILELILFFYIINYIGAK